jgi:hypothetical protein
MNKNKKRKIFTGPDFEDGLLAMTLVAQGKSTKRIMQKVKKYSPGMIRYRSKFLNISIQDYRNGTTPLARELEKRNTDYLMKRLTPKIDDRME